MARAFGLEEKEIMRKIEDESSWRRGRWGGKRGEHINEDYTKPEKGKSG